MSRIEMAMEKAARLRQEGEGEPARQAPRTTGAQAVPPQVPAAQALSPKNPFLVTIHEPHSQAAEEYRKLKSVLVHLTDGDPFKNAIMVTSSVPGEGKSLTALNLAVSLAQGFDHTVLLVEADLRRPSLHRYLGFEPRAGLADVLKGEAAIEDTIIQTGIGKLAVIGSGAPVENPVELFTSQKMRAIVDELKSRYPDRYLIFDTSPVLPFAESRALTSVVDGVVFVVMERLASQAQIKEAYDHLKGAVLGVVYNAAQSALKDQRYSYARYYEAQAQS
ncbi:XrtA-associated tyrosine autokinase [Geomonas anaerohicana]|uniref:Polysaccharide biosynthesis tyrosine autokinase n=1 Tax=Geomonas anaerohicana TaxID=2798583 RepID=A0ABS0YBW9_9BACT|nr:XrtA-associated tyrosine autokinase [Geomonas anaerohicana]MBJ6749813.1 polysaccharide biosynthesis tyrosine autokinase [Geomonas anaerohicana]